VIEYVGLGMKTNRALELTGLTKHQLYYKPSSKNRPGAKPSIYTVKTVGPEQELVSNDSIVEVMRHNHEDPDLHYGYRRMTAHLKLSGFRINHKKVYRLMKENEMLHDRFKFQGKTYAKYRKVLPKGPLELLEMDIKYQFIMNDNRHAYILTVIDTFTRMVLGWHLAYSIKQHCVKSLWEQIIVNHLQENNMLKKGVNIEIRNDNDKRFSAQLVQDFFEENYLNQVFTHPYTPEENGHVESFHSILGRSLNRRGFVSIKDLENHLIIFYQKYNNERIHSSIAMLPPRIFWNAWEKNWIERTVTKKKKVKFKILKSFEKIKEIYQVIRA